MTGEQSYVVVQAVAGKEEDARVLMHELGYEGAGPWMVRYGIDSRRLGRISLGDSIRHEVTGTRSFRSVICLTIRTHDALVAS